MTDGGALDRQPLHSLIRPSFFRPGSSRGGGSAGGGVVVAVGADVGVVTVGVVDDVDTAVLLVLLILLLLRLRRLRWLLLALPMDLMWPTDLLRQRLLLMLAPRCPALSSMALLLLSLMMLLLGLMIRAPEKLRQIGTSHDNGHVLL